MTVDGLAAAILHAVDKGRRDLLAAIDQLRIGGGEAQQRGFPGTEGHGQRRHQIIGNAETAGIIHHRLHPDGAGEPHGHQVARFLDPETQCTRPIKAV